MSVLSIRNLDVTYDNGLRAVNDVTFDVAEGEIVALLGPSGCGKTSTLRCIAGLEEPSNGTIRIGDTVVAGPDIFIQPQNRNINMVFQSYAIWPHLTVFENVAYGLRARRRPPAEIDERVEAALTMVRLSDLKDRYPYRLSGGQQQRVALARAIVTRPRLVLFDEPLSNLDAGLRVRMREEIANLQRSLRNTAIYVTHDQEEAMAIADRIILMNKGRIEQAGTPAEIYDRPRSVFAARFIGTSNIFDADVAEASSGDLIKVRISCGDEVLAWKGEYQFDKSDKVAIMVRPEAVKLAAAGNGRSAEPNMLSGTVERSLYLGGHFEQVIKVKDLTVMAESRGGSRFEPGAEVTVAFEPKDAIALPAEAAATTAH